MLRGSGAGGELRENRVGGDRLGEVGVVYAPNVNRGLLTANLTAN